MTNPKDKSDPFARLVGGLVQDMMDLTDAELSAELRERGEDPALIAGRARAVFEKAVRERGKRRLTAARTAVDDDAAIPRKVVKLDAVSARARLEKLLRRSPETAKKLTIAARKGEGLSDADVLGLLSNLEELGVRDEDDL